ncbi:MAG: hypothetical protein GY909_07610 [Oligoflexia bacterium]|nr:hypothetical protein [Oligoflexia bacterium]
MKNLLLVFTFLFSFAVNSEYRVYQYYVKPAHELSMDQKSHLVTSTLDPVSYISYHGGNEVVKIDLLRSWMCKGNTANQQMCPPPFEELQAKRAQ